MDNLDLLIEKFKEAKGELQKGEEVENLDKAYVSSVSKYGTMKATKPKSVEPQKVTTPPVEAPKPKTLRTAAVERFKTPAVPKAKTLTAEDSHRAKTGNPTMSKKEDEDMEKASAAGIRGGQATMLPKVPALSPESPATPPVRSAKDVRGGTARVLPNLPKVGSAKGVRGTPGGATGGVGLQGQEPPKLNTYQGRGVLMRSEEEKLSFNKGGQWSLDKAVNTAIGTPNDSLAQSEDEDKKDDKAEKIDGGDMGLNRGV